MKTNRLSLAAVLFAGLSMPLSADVLVVEERGAFPKERPIVDIQVPTRGMSMVFVEDTHGEPLQKLAAVGEPPITRWEYENFTVYFEFDKVIHAVKVIRH
ncbi:MAG: hypothetical protein MJA83_02985 [Gammaproteobacteria bacterium]|nr:hypothetical protein [Gammaproteobacteria bacterium]